MLLFIVFLLGIANFALHRLILESKHPLLSDARRTLTGSIGPYGSYVLEFVILLVAMGFAHRQVGLILLFYGGYTLLNMLGAWLLLRRHD